MRLSQYILDNPEPILQEFEDFARTHTARGASMDVAALRNHAAAVLEAIARDLEQPQSDETEVRRSRGDAPPPEEALETAAEHHGVARAVGGFTVDETAAEFRALRASVLRLWDRAGLPSDETALRDMVRFNEAIDHALMQSIARFSAATERVSSTVAEIARRAIAEPKLEALLEHVTEQVTEVLEVEYSRVLQFLPEERALIVRAATGFPEEHVDRHRLAVDDEFGAWLASDPPEPLRVRDLGEEPGDARPIELEPHGAGSIAIRGANGPWGVLQACCASPRTYGYGERDFMRTAADILAQSVERSAAEERLRFQATLLDAVGDAVMALDQEGRVTHWNRQAEELYGWREDEAMDRYVVDLLMPDAERERALGLLQDVSEGHAWSGEMRVLRKGGTAVPVLAVLTPVYDKKSERVIGSVSASNDISERLQFDEKLRQSQKMEALGRLAGGVAHDFNNLLTTVSGFTDLMLDELPEDAPVHDFAREIQGAARRATTLTAQLLAFSRRQAILPQYINPRQVVKGMEKLLHRIIGEHIEIVFTADGRSSRVLADPTQIEQVIMNLAVNARDAMPLGGTLTISIENRRLDAPLSSGEDEIPPGPYVVISVRDTGSGMPADIQPKVFDPFFTTKAKGKGTGLGLSTVYGIVQQSGGGILMKSSVGEGTTFSVFLPEIEDGADEEDLGESGEEVGLPSGEGRTVLVAEDDVSVRALLARLLPRLGYRVIEAGNGEDALKLYREHAGRVDLVLTDVIMPVMSGPELAAALEREQSEVPVIFMSGYTDDVLEGQNLKSGAPLIQKPFTAAELRQELEEALAARPDA